MNEAGLLRRRSKIRRHAGMPTDFSKLTLEWSRVRISA
jgi:hypothetical protein